MLKRIGEGQGVPLDTRDPVMPRLLCLVRHGESIGQVVQRRFREGDPMAYTEEFRRTPSSQWSLTRLGFAQGLRTGDWMEEVLGSSPLLPGGNFDRAFYSPYKRARQSLGAVVLGALRRRHPTYQSPKDLNAFLAQFNIAQVREDFRLDSDEYPATSDMRARELDFGNVSTITKDEFKERYPDYYKARVQEPMYARLPGGESLGDLSERARSFMGALTRAYIGGTQSALVVAHGRFMTMLDFALRGIVPESPEHFEAVAADVENAEAIMLSRINPDEPGDERRAYHWRSSVVPWRSPRNEPPVWEEFEVKSTATVGELLGDIDESWLLLPPAGYEG